jgi:PhnB protein
VDQYDEVSLIPVLSVSRPHDAIAFYERAFAARTVRLDTVPDGTVFALLAVGRAQFEVTNGQDDTPSPDACGGTTVRLSLTVHDPDAVAQAAVKAGAVLLHPIADQSYGWRQGRVVDPYGHHWMIGRPLESGA